MFNYIFTKYQRALAGLLFFPLFSFGQLKWTAVTNFNGPLPKGMELYQFEGIYMDKPFRAFYAAVELRNSKLKPIHDTTNGRRITPTGFYEKNDRPILVVNTSFFSFEENKNLNIIVNRGKLLAPNNHTIVAKGADSGLYLHPLVSALGISRRGKMDIAWTYTSDSLRYPLATQRAFPLYKDSLKNFRWVQAKSATDAQLRPWKMRTVVGGGPVLIQHQQSFITNNQEWKFAGKALQDTHPRTAMGYTANGRLIVLVVEGRNPNKAMGATLPELAQIMLDLECVEAINLDGGGSTCMLINGKETIKPSDKEGQRAIPAAFIVK